MRSTSRRSRRTSSAHEVRAPGYPARLARQLELTLDGDRAPLRVLESRVVSRPGAGGLKTLRLDVVYVAEGDAARAAPSGIRSFAGRIGWREVTLSARDGASIVPLRRARDE